MSISIKPIVFYTQETIVVYQSPGGLRASLVPLNHPNEENVVNGTYANTSPIISIDANTGFFETKNTEYRPSVDLVKPLILPEAQ